MSDRIETSRTVGATPQEVYDLLADPRRHGEFADMMRGPGDGCEPVREVGDEFIVSMNNELLGDYQMINRIVCFERNRRIGWAPILYPSIEAYQDKLGDIKPGGHTFT